MSQSHAEHLGPPSPLISGRMKLFLSCDSSGQGVCLSRQSGGWAEEGAIGAALV